MGADGFHKAILPSRIGKAVNGAVSHWSALALTAAAASRAKRPTLTLALSQKEREFAVIPA